MTRPTARLVSASAALALALGLAPLTMAASQATPVAPAPAGLHVVRTGAAQTTLAISWKAVAGVDHYRVTVFDGKTDTVRVVAAGATTYSFAGSGDCTRYRVRVAAVRADGTSGTSNDYLVGSLAPGGITTVSASRDAVGTTGRLGWAASANGNGAATSYRVVVSQLAGGKVLASRQSADTVETVTGLDKARVYVARVTPTNAFGSCTTGTVLLGNKFPTSPAALRVTRSLASTKVVDLTWAAPSWAGYGPVTSYDVGYGIGSATTWVRTTATHLSLPLDQTKDWVLTVRATSGTDTGVHAAPVTVVHVGAAGTPAVDPRVTVADIGTSVLVTFSGPVGSSTAYPKMFVAIAPAAGTATFRDSMQVSNRAGAVDFADVPCGAYTVTVTGLGATTSKELVRTVVDRCHTGLVAANQWKIITGTATFTSTTVDLPTGTVFATVPRTTQDVAVTTDATLASGMGYGVWVHASADSAGNVSGISVQYDHGWGNYVVLRQWNAGAECSGPLAVAAFPAGLDVTAKHRVAVVASGDTITMSIDGATAFTLPSLAKAIASSSCRFPAPTGTSTGFRTWGSAVSAVFANTAVV